MVKVFKVIHKFIIAYASKCVVISWKKLTGDSKTAGYEK